jgi:His/Glu/Gln/Arg/opine family amino acid ABC transporter permease subunit
MELDFSILIEHREVLINGFQLTIFIVICAICLGLPMGALLAIGRMSPRLYLRGPAVAVLEIVRNTPFIIQAFLFYHGLLMLGGALPEVLVGILALALYSSAYYAEIIRAGILAVPKGQAKSARAVGMSHAQSLRNVVFPQMWPIVLPPITSQTMSLVKESSILSTITVWELTLSAQSVQGVTFRPFELFILTALLYWGTNESIAFGVRRLEKRLQKRHSPQATTVAQIAMVDASIEAVRRVAR